MICTTLSRLARLSIGLSLVLLAGPVGATEQPHFPTPDDAVQALIEAADAKDGNAVLTLLGPRGEDVRSNDPVANALEGKGFVAAAKEATRIDLDGDDYALLSIGDDAWPFPIPLIKEPEGWRFDTEAGIEELLDRRIGRNELHTIAVAREFVEAEHEYASENRNGDGKPEFAQKLMSAAGERDGLYWPTTEGEQASPMGPLVAEAVVEGYEPGQGDEPAPYHGYYYRILTAQGEKAPGGAKSYIVDGHMTRGFSLLAYPAEYGNSGIMSFIVNQSGILFQKDLGKDTTALATAIAAYNPDRSWEPVTD